MKYFEADLLLHVPPPVSQSTWVVLSVTKFTVSLVFRISVQQCHCTSLMLSLSVFSRILDLLFILDPICTLFSRTNVPFYPYFVVDLGYNMERTRVAQLNNLVRYGTVPGSGIYGTIQIHTSTAQGQKIAPASTRFPKNFGIMSMRNRAWLFYM